MATFFGEVLTPSSRAVDEEDDDDESPDVNLLPAVVRWTPKTRSEMEKSNNQCLQCNTLIVAIGEAATGFAQTYILHQDTEVIGVLGTGLDDKDVNTFSQRSATDKVCHVHRLIHNPDVLVCLCNTHVAPEQAFSWVHKLFGSLPRENLYVSILTTIPASQFHSECPHNDLPLPFLRALRTSAYKGTPVCPYLEQPNTLTGLHAQILSYCQIHQIAAVVYVCYTDAYVYVDPRTMKIFQPILGTTPIKDVAKAHPKAEELLADIATKYAEKNTLYL